MVQPQHDLFLKICQLFLFTLLSFRCVQTIYTFAHYQNQAELFVFSKGLLIAFLLLNASTNICPFPILYGFSKITNNSETVSPRPAKLLLTSCQPGLSLWLVQSYTLEINVNSDKQLIIINTLLKTEVLNITISSVIHYLLTFPIKWFPSFLSDI